MIICAFPSGVIKARRTWKADEEHQR